MVGNHRIGISELDKRIGKFFLVSIQYVIFGA